MHAPASPSPVLEHKANPSPQPTDSPFPGAGTSLGQRQTPRTKLPLPHPPSLRPGPDYVINFGPLPKRPQNMRGNPSNPSPFRHGQQPDPLCSFAQSGVATPHPTGGPEKFLSPHYVRHPQPTQIHSGAGVQCARAIPHHFLASSLACGGAKSIKGTPRAEQGAVQCAPNRVQCAGGPLPQTNPQVHRAKGGKRCVLFLEQICGTRA